MIWICGRVLSPHLVAKEVAAHLPTGLAWKPISSSVSIIFVLSWIPAILPPLLSFEGRSDLPHPHPLLGIVLFDTC